VHKQYEQARATIGRGLLNGPLAGVPYLIKDLAIFEAGEPARLGSSLYADFIADHDTKRAGLVIMGRSSTPESAHPRDSFSSSLRLGRSFDKYLDPPDAAGYCQTVRAKGGEELRGFLRPLPLRAQEIRPPRHRKHVPVPSYAFSEGLIHAENLGGDIEMALNQRFIIGAFPRRYEGLEACPCRIVCFSDCGDRVEAVGHVAKAHLARRS
jgi:hypothetical protein